MTSPLPPSPLSSPGISDQDVEVVSPGNLAVENAAGDRDRVLNEPITIDVGNSEPPSQMSPSAMLQNEPPPKPQDEDIMAKNTAFSDGQGEVIDLAASSDEDSSKKDLRTGSTDVDVIGENDRAAGLQKQADTADADKAQHQQENSCDDLAGEETPQANGRAALLEIPNSSPIQKPSEPDDSNEMEVFDQDAEVPHLSHMPAAEPEAFKAASDPAAEVPHSSHMPAAEPEAFKAASDPAASGTKEMAASAEPAETKDVVNMPDTEPATSMEDQNVPGIIADGSITVENGEMEVDVTTVDVTENDGAPAEGTDSEMEVDAVATTVATANDGAPTEGSIAELSDEKAVDAATAAANEVARETEAKAPTEMDVDPTGTPPEGGNAENADGVENSDAEKIAPSLGADGSLPTDLSLGVLPVKRSSPDPTSDQPPAKKAKDSTQPPQPDVAESVTKAPDISISATSPASQQKAEGPGSNPDEVKSVLSPREDGLPSEPVVSKEGKNHPPCDPFFASCVDLSPIPEVSPLPLLSPRDIAELESALQIGDKYRYSDDNSWRDDWSGNLQLIDKELLMNRGQIAQDPQTKPLLLPFVEWVAKTAKGPNGFRGVQLLFSYVHHMNGCPQMAQKIMAYSLQRPAKTVEDRLKFILDGIRRITYDPTVLTQDGWTTAKAETPDGVSGGAFLIGRRVIWHRYEAIIIAFVRDEEIGDLWKAIWLEDHDTFDLEADELQEALKKWERKDQMKQRKLANRQTLLGGTVKPQGYAGKDKAQSTSMRFAASSNFTIDGIEHGIILATSFNQQARLGVPWPARVMHVSEVKAMGTQPSRGRSSSKNNIHVVFLAPYWNGQYSFSSKKPGPVSSKVATATDPFSAGSLFEMDTIEVSESTIKKYPFDIDGDTLSIDRLMTNFRFLGLPKLAFSRYLAAHRLAMAFKSYAKKEIGKKPTSTNNQAQAGALSALTDAHTLSVRAHLFPQASLDLPFDFVLSKLPCPVEQAAQVADDEETTEPIVSIHAMLKSLSPPRCFGLETSDPAKVESPQSDRGMTPVKSPDPKFSMTTPSDGEGQKQASDDSLWSVSNFASGYLLKVIGPGTANGDCPPKLPYLGKHFADLVGVMRQETESVQNLPLEKRRERLGAFLKQCLVIKGHGEDIIYSNKSTEGLNIRNVVIEWRKACERVYKRASVKCSVPGFGDGLTLVITDSRCNQHITASGSFERAVRLPAAIKGAKKAGAGQKESMPLLYTVDSKYMDIAEEDILPKAHKASYLKRLKAKIANLPADAKGMPLTDDSDGEGGEDTMGSRGSYTAAVLGVAAAIQGVDMIVGGQCVNVFCAIRPPGHHAGKELRPMSAISNGFCLLNAAACAALYATAPQAEGGLGLKRVCVIDFDVHHGNGTQDILCSTHDSRFLYVSLHAGGAHINGYEDEGEAQDGHTGLGSGKHEGIFPGRCGDTSPHEGVLNIPLGQKVTAAAVGNALVTRVFPAVEKFCPELIVLSAGFDAHKHDPLGMGGLSAEDFGSVTEVACQMAFKTCSGRVISVLEGGYGVPCCRSPSDLFLPDNMKNSTSAPKTTLPPVRLLDLGDDLPDSMEDPVTPHLQQKLERCHQEGFVECIQSHVGALSKYSRRGK